MTKEELVKDAEDFLQKKWGTSKMLILGGDASEVLADFVEPREKRIEELEKENKVLAQNLEDTEILNKTYEKKHNDLKKENAELKSLKDVADLIRLNNSHIVAMAQLNNNNVALRKENAELKDDNMVMAKNYSKMEQKFYNNLTNAKEIISEYINILKGDTKNWKKTQEKAEQFLKDCEVK